MKRREFITLLGGTAAARPLAARAQQPAVPVVGFLGPTSLTERLESVAEFRKGLAKAGYIEGQNVAIEFRWAEGQYGRFPELAAELVRRQVSVIATPGSTPAALAAKAATNSIPIVFSIGDDPVKYGLVASLARPGGNATGVSYFTHELGAKRLGLMRDLMPVSVRVAVLTNPNNPSGESGLTYIQAAARAIGQQIDVLPAISKEDIDVAFATLVQRQFNALLINSDALFTARRVQIVTLAARYGIPVMYSSREYAEVGGLMSYGTSLPDMYHQVGVYAGRILKGERPTDLPVMRPTKFEFVINLQTAKTMGLTVPPGLLAIADAVIE